MSCCALCNEILGEKTIQEEQQLFCCHGCQAVYSILASQGNLNQKENHPLLQQAVKFGLISNPTLIEKISAKEKNATNKLQQWVFEVGEMWCPACAELIRLVMGQQKGVARCHVDYITDLASVQFDPLEIGKKDIQTLIEDLGYAVNALKDQEMPTLQFSLLLRTAIAGFCAFNVMMFAYPLYTTYFTFEEDGMRSLLAWISFVLTIPVMLFSGYPIYKRMWIQCKQGFIAMESLVGIGTIAALLLSLYEMFKGTYQVYFDTITVLITFLLVGKIFETKAKFSTKEALIRLHHALPRKGRKQFPDGTLKFVALKEISIGDLLVAYAGERIVLDGALVAGEGACDESILTGEVNPVYKQVGDSLLAGTILQNGRLAFRVMALPETSAIQRILNLIEQEIGNKSIYVRAADKVVKWFAPLVIGVAFFTWMMTFALDYSMVEATLRSVALLLIACPCAIGIAAPLVESRLIHRFAERGALIRNRSLLAILPQVTHFVFDKTGTLTHGKFAVLSGLEQLLPEQKQLLKGLASQSLHPIAYAIDQALSVNSRRFDSVREIAGRGMEGKWNGDYFYLGSAKLLADLTLTIEPPDHSHTIVYFFSSKQILAQITLGDVYREEASAMLQALAPAKRWLLSGDRQAAVKKLADALPIEEWFAEKSPLEKQHLILQLKNQGGIVAMMGDGINDAPALSAAHVAISVVSATDISIQVSDLLLTNERLTLLPELCALAKKGSRLIRQNLFWAFFYNIIGIILAALGLLTPLFASAAMLLSSLIVLLNARRI